MKPCRIPLLLLGSLLCSGLFPVLTIIATPDAYGADAPWKVEFDQVCGNSDNAINLSVDELNKLLERCDRLKPQIEQLEATPRKIYSKRLLMCRNLFAYMLENRNKSVKP